MYQKNDLMRNVLITPMEVMFHAPTKQQLDLRMVEQSIIVAEERFIRSEVGFDMYDYMVNSKNVTVTGANLATLQAAFDASNPNQKDPYVLVEGDVINAFEQMNPSYQRLWKQHLWKLTAECVLLSAFPEGFVQFGSEGVIHNNPPAGLMVTSGFVTPLLPSVKWALDKKIQDRVSPLTDSLHSYVCKYLKTDGFDTYYRKACPECDKGEPKRKWSGLALGLYDDDDENRCCED